MDEWPRSGEAVSKLRIGKSSWNAIPLSGSWSGERFVRAHETAQIWKFMLAAPPKVEFPHSLRTFEILA